ncbi:Gfo/Idh/MocA family oxidoreductase [bacterium]|nr:Gfo/Idh/MocA family oxidoreductase [bacterium]
MPKEIRIGVIGATGRGRFAWAMHNPENGVSVVAGADIYEEKLDIFRERFGEKNLFTTKDYRQLLAKKDINTVFVTSPDFMHEEHAVASLEAGKDIYLEKPMAITVEGCDRILRAAYENGKKVYIGHNMRHMAVVKKMKELIDKGSIGEVKTAWCRHFVDYGGDAYFKDWHAERSKSTGLLLQKGSHDIDVLHWLCNGVTARVTAVGGLTLYDKITDRHHPSERGDARWSKYNWPPMSQKGLNPIIDVEDISMMLMVLDNGIYASYQQCHFTPDGSRNYTFIGTEGRIENFGISPGSAIVRLWNRRGSANQYGNEQHFVPHIVGGHGGSDIGILGEFLNYVRYGTKITTSPIAGRYSVAAGYYATQSIRNGNLPYDIPGLPKEIYDYFNKDLL